uniref:Uncharacterized protein n=1 Tax=viral metagenome TaxID=1070528 RepID=A0A6C0HBN2_9ZZZZ
MKIWFGGNTYFICIKCNYNNKQINKNSGILGIFSFPFLETEKSRCFFIKNFMVTKNDVFFWNLKHLRVKMVFSIFL